MMMMKKKIRVAGTAGSRPHTIQPFLRNRLYRRMAKYSVTVQLSGQNGNAIVVIGSVIRGLKRAGAPQSEIDKFKSEATSGNYDHVIQTAMKWVNVA